MDVFLDMTGTITDMNSENEAFLKMCEKLAKEFTINIPAEKLADKIKEYRRPFMEKRAEKYIPIRHLIADAVEEIIGKKLKEEEREEVYQIYEDSHARYVQLAPGASEALKMIRSMADAMGIVTDADTPYTEKVVRALGIENLFDCIITAEDVGVGKPNPKIFQMAINCGKSDPRIFIGDSEKRDIKGAKKVGFITIKIGKRTEEGDFLTKNLWEATQIIRKFFYRDNTSP